ncbi:MAG: hypothetical protein ACTSUK_01020 [Promethearchaeota archaeon]
MDISNGENITFTITTVVEIVVFVGGLIGIWYKLAGKMKVMDLELTTARNEMLKMEDRMQKEVDKLDESSKEENKKIHKRINAANERAVSTTEQLTDKIENLQKDVHDMSLKSVEQKNEILEAIRNNK